MLAGAGSIAAIAEWAADAPQPVRAALGARRDVPGHFAVPAEATIRRTLSRLDPDALAVAVGAWLADRDRGPGPAGAGRRRAVAVHGKTLRGAHPPDGDGRPVQLLAAMTTPAARCWPNTKSAARPARCPLSPRCWPHWTSPTSWSPPTPSRPTPRPPGFLVTSKQAHDLFVVKANQPTLLDRLKRLAWRLVPELDRTGDRGHGRIEIRTLKAVSVHHFGFPTPPKSSRSPASPATCATIPGGARP